MPTTQTIAKAEIRPAGRVALLGILCALAVGLSFLEGLLPVLPVPGAKLGLSNIIVMYALSALNLPAALAGGVRESGVCPAAGGHRFPDESGGRTLQHSADGGILPGPGTAGSAFSGLA